MTIASVTDVLSESAAGVPGRRVHRLHVTKRGPPDKFALPVVFERAWAGGRVPKLAAGKLVIPDP